MKPTLIATVILLLTSPTWPYEKKWTIKTRHDSHSVINVRKNSSKDFSEIDRSLEKWVKQKKENQLVQCRSPIRLTKEVPKKGPIEYIYCEDYMSPASLAEFDSIVGLISRTTLKKANF